MYSIGAGPGVVLWEGDGEGRPVLSRYSVGEDDRCLVWDGTGVVEAWP